MADESNLALFVDEGAVRDLLDTEVWDGFAEFGLVVGSRLKLKLYVPHLLVKGVQSLLHSVFFLGYV